MASANSEGPWRNQCVAALLLEKGATPPNVAPETPPIPDFVSTGRSTTNTRRQEQYE